MNEFKKVIPVIVAIDMQQSIEFYQRLGFKTSYGDDNYTSLCLGALEIHLSPMTGLTKEQQQLVGGWMSFRIEVDEIDSLHQHYIDNDVINQNQCQLVLKDYGMKEFTVLDPAGIAVTFFRELESI